MDFGKRQSYQQPIHRILWITSAYRRLLQGKWHLARHRLTKRDFQAAVGVSVAIGLVAGISSSTSQHLLLAPFGATAVIAFLTFDSPFAAPRNIIGGYLVTSCVGMATAFFLGHSWWTYALGVGAAMLCKRVLDVVHPPSAAMPILLLRLDDHSLVEFALRGILPGLLVLVGTAIVYNRWLLRNGYPLWDHGTKRC